MDRIEDGSPARLLRQFGISANAEAVWQALLDAPDVSIERLSDAGDLTSSEVASAIDELVAARLARGGETPTGVLATDPSLAIETFIARAERQLAAQSEALAAVRTQIPALSEQYARGRAAAGDEPGFEIIVPLQDIRRQLYLAADRVRHDIRSVEHLPGTAGFAELRTAQYALLARGVRDRLVIATDGLLDPVVFAHYERLEARGHRTRTLPDVGTRMLVYDQDLAVLPVDPANIDRGAIFVRVRSVIDLLIFMYDHLWSIAKPVFSVQLDWQTPSGRPARVLELIAAGTKDESIARTLRVAVRTVRRDIAELKQALGVNTRAEVVAAAVRKGWL